MSLRNWAPRFIMGAGLLWFGLMAVVFAAPGADLVVLGEIRTMADAAPRAEGFAVKGDQLVYVGAAAGAQRQLRPGGRLIRLAPGQLALPGLIDSHVHMFDAGIMGQRLELDELKTKEALLAVIAAYAKAHPELTWVVGSGWASHLFEGGAPKKADLDAVIADRPAVFYGQDGHSSWVNSAALRAAGITRQTPDPPGGRILRDAAGEPSGTLVEEAAQDLVEARIPKPSREMALAGLRAAQQRLHSVGITMIQDANVDASTLGFYSDAARSGQLTMKVVAAQITNPNRPASQVDDLVRLRDQHTVGPLTAGTAKIFVDGVIEFRTAALNDPYEGSEQERGILRWEPGALAELAARLDRSGFQIHMHAIGDRAVGAAVKALAAVRAANGAGDNRHHVAHLELVDPADIPRFRELGVVANFQPFWMFADESITQSTIPVLGAARGSRLYPIRSFADSGVRLAAGSDWPVSTPDPFQAIQVGITRQSPTPPYGEPWIPAERVSLMTLLKAYTIGGAYVNHREEKTGSLVAGKAADFIILDRNLFNIEPHDIGKTRVLSTFVDGREVYKYRPGKVASPYSPRAPRFSRSRPIGAGDSFGGRSPGQRISARSAGDGKPTGRQRACALSMICR
jgi:predicted amidohydrolase YtcJ